MSKAYVLVYLKSSFSKVLSCDKNDQILKFVIAKRRTNLNAILSLLDKFKVTSEHVLIMGHCPLM